MAEVLVDRHPALFTALRKIGAVKFGEFRLKLHEQQPDAPLSPLYIDLRLVRSYPPVMRTMAKVLGDIVRPLPCDCVADVPTAVTPIVGYMAASYDIPMVTPRIDVKHYGRGKTVDGVFHTKDVVVLVDDLITGAHSKLQAIARLEEVGLIVKDVVVLIDRGQGGKEELAARGYKLHSAITLGGLMDWYLGEELISVDEYHRVRDYLIAEETARLNQSPA